MLGLDGLRAFSISLVLIAQLLGTRNFHPPEVISRVLGIFSLGPLGVRVFFVISGFLITSLLLEEERRTGTVSLSCFHFRRTLRIFPPYYLYISIIVSPAYLLIIPAVLAINALGRFAKLNWVFCSTAQNVLIALFIERVTRSEQGYSDPTK